MTTLVHRSRRVETAARGHRRVTFTLVAALVSLYAGAIHLYAVGDHVGEWWGYPAFFVAVGTAQILLAVMVLLRPGALTSVVGVLTNLAVVAVYVVSRTAGVPVGPVHSAHRLEPAGTLDLAATAAEVLLVALLVCLAPGRTRRWLVDVALLVGLALWVLHLTGRLG